jgi:hypothetical protein
MSWYSIKERGSKGGHSRVKELTHKAKAILEDLCEEFEDMDEYFGERDDDMYEREDYGERRGRSGRYMR